MAIVRPYLRIEGEMAMIQQLRIYEIFENNKAAFHARFRDHAARIMRTRYGFQIVAMWETRLGDRTEFAYLLEWPDETTKTAAWSAFMADTEWSEIKQQRLGRIARRGRERVFRRHCEPTGRANA